MFSDERAYGILQRLLEKTRANQVNWRSEDELTEDLPSFYMLLPASILSVAPGSAGPDLESVVIDFRNTEDAIVKRVVIEEGSPQWSMAKGLYEEAGRVSLGWDRVLDDLETAVSSREKIGLAPRA